MGRIGLSYVVFWLAMPLFAGAAESATRTFVTQLYFHGVPYIEARSLGAAAVPELVDMLDEPELAPFWTNIVTTLGFIGDPAAVAPMLDFARRQEGEISADVFRAALSVATALGHLAHDGDDEALQQLIAWTRDTEGSGIRLSYKHYSGAALDEVLGRMAVQALGISGRTEALERLHAMAGDRAMRADWEDNVSEALELHHKVKSRGVASVAPKGGER